MGRDGLMPGRCVRACICIYVLLRKLSVISKTVQKSELLKIEFLKVVSIEVVIWVLGSTLEWRRCQVES